MTAATNYIHEDNLLIVLLSGRLDTTSAPEIEEQMAKEFTDERDLVLDCKDLEYISSAGLRLFLSWQKKVMKNSGTLTLINVNENVNEILDITGFSDILKVEKYPLSGKK